MLQLLEDISSKVISSSCIIIHKNATFDTNLHCNIVGKHIFIHKDYYNKLINAKNIRLNGNIYSVTDKQITDIINCKDIEKYISSNGHQLKTVSNEIKLER